jgi:hypothetical protein
VLSYISLFSSWDFSLSSSGFQNSSEEPLAIVRYQLFIVHSKTQCGRELLYFIHQHFGEIGVWIEDLVSSKPVTQPR